MVRAHPGALYFRDFQHDMAVDGEFKIFQFSSQSHQKMSSFTINISLSYIVFIFVVILLGVLEENSKFNSTHCKSVTKTRDCMICMISSSHDKDDNLELNTW